MKFGSSFPSLPFTRKQEEFTWKHFPAYEMWSVYCSIPVTTYICRLLTWILKSASSFFCPQKKVKLLFLLKIHLQTKGLWIFLSRAAAVLPLVLKEITKNWRGKKDLASLLWPNQTLPTAACLAHRLAVWSLA